MGSDGVLRAFDSERKVVDYRQLSPEEIAVIIRSFPPDVRGDMEQQLHGVDGRNVTDLEQLFIRPAISYHPHLPRRKRKRKEIIRVTRSMMSALVMRERIVLRMLLILSSRMFPEAQSEQPWGLASVLKVEHSMLMARTST